MICAVSGADRKTLARYLQGLPMKPTLVERIQAAARQLGIALPARGAEGAR